MAGSASACSFTNWNGGTSATAPTPGQPTDATPVPRYSGKCGLLSTGTGQFVIDNTPATEAAYRVRFYVYTGLVSGTATVFQALNNSAAAAITVDYNATAGNFAFTTGAGTTNVGGAIVQNRWYAIELSWTNGGNMDINVQGNAATTTTAGQIGAGPSTNIDSVKLGWVAGAGVTDATHKGIVVDAFESRRATAIGRLCRADANNSGTITAADRSAITAELGASLTLGTGQPDANEDGRVTAGDRSAITALLAINATCADNH